MRRLFFLPLMLILAAYGAHAVEKTPKWSPDDDKKKLVTEAVKRIEKKPEYKEYENAVSYKEISTNKDVKAAASNIEEVLADFACCKIAAGATNVQKRECRRTLDECLGSNNTGIGLVMNREEEARKQLKIIKTALKLTASDVLPPANRPARAQATSLEAPLPLTPEDKQRWEDLKKFKFTDAFKGLSADDKKLIEQTLQRCTDATKIGATPSAVRNCSLSLKAAAVKAKPKK